MGPLSFHPLVPAAVQIPQTGALRFLEESLDAPLSPAPDQNKLNFHFNLSVSRIRTRSCVEISPQSKIRSLRLFRGCPDEIFRMLK